MKQFYRSLIAGLLVVVLLASMIFTVAATELKTGIGIVDASALRLRSGASTTTAAKLSPAVTRFLMRNPTFPILEPGANSLTTAPRRATSRCRYLL